MKKSDFEIRPLFSIPSIAHIKVFSTWGLAALLGFPLVYGATNHLASLRAEHFNIWFSWEVNTPFIKEFIWAYLSLNLVLFLPLFMVSAEKLKRYCQANLATLLIGGIIFLIFPASLGFQRVIPSDPFYAGIFSSFFALDKPHNLVPSLHVTFSALSLYCVAEFHSHRKWLLYTCSIWMLLISLSVIFVRQHHLADIIGGGLLAYLGIRFVYFRASNETKESSKSTHHRYREV